MLWLLHLQVLGEVAVKFRQKLVGDDLRLVAFETRNDYLLSGCAEGQLLLDQIVRALPKDLVNFLVVIKLDGNSEGNSILRVGKGDVVQNGQSFDEFLLVCRIPADGSKIHVNFGKVLRVDKGLDIFEFVDDEQKIDGVVLGIVGNKIWDNPVHHGDQLVVGLVVLQTQLVLPSDVGGKIAHILMTPTREVSIGALQQVVKTGTLSLLSENHRQH